MSQIYRLRTRFTTAEMDKDLGLMDIDTGKYYVMNPISRAIWDLLEQSPRSAEEICEEMISLYNGNQNDIKADVIEFLEELQNKGLIIIK